jgi:Ser/Thr protein kinase RdoA (MazF antagonist)
MAHDIRSIVNLFACAGRFVSGTPYGSGHIHDTYLVECDSRSGPHYILQRINHAIFPDVPALMNNLARVTGHIKKKLAQTPGADPQREALTLVPTREGRSFFQDAVGNYWRVFVFIPGTRTHDVVTSPALAFEGGRAFGRFQQLLADLPGGPLAEIIPGFHDVERRLTQLQAAVERDARGRVKEVQAELAFVRERAFAMMLVTRLQREGKIKLRITHNDTKFNNLLFDDHDRAVCVIDLDIVMPGYPLYDFGDAIRTVANAAAEDEADLAKVELDLDLFQAFARGFLASTLRGLTPLEIDLLPFGAKMIIFIIGLRFLTDYIAGDTYFKIHSPEHNLRRARAQFKLLQSAEAHADAMQEIMGRIRHELGD